MSTTGAISEIVVGKRPHHSISAKTLRAQSPEMAALVISQNVLLRHFRRFSRQNSLRASAESHAAQWRWEHDERLRFFRSDDRSQSALTMANNEFAKAVGFSQGLF